MMTHDEARRAIDVLFDMGSVTPERWDQLFAHLRAGCEGCRTHYSTRRGECPDADDPITRAESDAVRRVLIARAEASRKRSPFAGRWAILASTLTAMCAGAFWLVLRDGETADYRGQANPAEATIVCLTPSGLLKPTSTDRTCAVGDTLNAQTSMGGEAAAREVVLVVIDQRLELLEDPEPVVWRTGTVSVVGPELRQAGELRAFVLWLKTPLDRVALTRSLGEARQASRPLSQLRMLSLTGVLAQQSFELRVLSGNGER